MKKILTLLLVVVLNSSTTLFATGTPQTITFDAIPNCVASVGTLTITATATSGLAVTFSVTVGGTVVSSVNTYTVIAGKSYAEVTLSGSDVGAVTITADRASGGGFDVAPTATRSFTVSKSANAFTFPTISNKTFPSTATTITLTPTYTATLNFGSTVFSSSDDAVASVDAATGLITCVGAGSVTITGTIAATATELGCTASRSFMVSKCTNAFTFPAIANQTYPANVSTITLSPTYTATANFGTTVFTSSNPSVASVDASTGLIECVGVGTVTVTATIAATASANGCTASRTFSVAKCNNVFTFPVVSNQVYPATATTITLSPSYSATTNLGTATYTTSASSVATVDASTGLITCVGTGTVTITGTIAATATAKGATASRTFSVAKTANTFVFPTIANQTFPVGATTITLSPTYTATANFGTTTYTTTASSVATVDPSTGLITCVGAGSVTITATIAATATANGSSASRTFTVSKSANTFTFPTIANQTYPATVSSITLTPSYTATSNFGTTTYSTNAGSIATVDATTGLIECVGTGTVTITATIPATATANGCTASRTFSVSKFANTFTFPVIANQTYSATVPTITLTPTYTASANLGTTVYSSSDALVASVDPSTGAIECVGTGAVTITATIAATPTVNGCSASRTFTVSKCANTFTFPTIANQTYPATASTITISPTYTATANFGTTAYTSSAPLVASVDGSTGLITCVGTGSVTITGTIAATATVNGATASKTFTVSKTANTFTFPAIASQTFPIGATTITLSPTYTASANFGTATYTTTASSVATVDPSTGLITCVGAGSVTISGTIAATATANGCSASRTFTVAKGANVFTFPTIANQVYPSTATTIVLTPSYTASANFGTATYTTTASSVATVDATTGAITCVGTGTVTITGTIPATASSNGCTASRTFSVSKTANAFIFPTIANQTFPATATTITLSPTYTAVANFGTATYMSSAPAVASVDPSTGLITCVGAGSVTITGTIAATATANGCSTARTFTVSKCANAFTFPTIANQTYSATASTIAITPTYTATANFGTTTYTSSDALVASVDPSTGAIECVGTGTVTITATIAATATANGCTAFKRFSVSKCANSFTFPAITNKVFPATATTIAITPTYTATANFGTASFTTSDALVATVDASTGAITCIGTGTVTITGTIAATATASGCTASRTFSVSKCLNSFTFPTLSNKIYPATATTIVITPSYTATANFGTATYASSDALVASVDASTGIITCVGTGTVTITGTIAATATANGCTASRTFSVSKTPNTFTFPLLGNRVFPVTASTITISPTYTATANFGTAVFTTSDAAVATVDAATGVIVCIGSGTVTITGTIAATATAKGCTASRRFIVTKASPIITFAAIGKQWPSDSPTASAVSSSGLAVTYSVVAGPASINASTGAITLSGPLGTVRIRATQAATAYCNAVSVDRTFSVITEGSTKSEITSIEEEVVTGLNVYPNPSNGVFTVAQTESINEINVFDMLGNTVTRMLKLNGASNTQVNLSGTPAGVYMVQVITTNGTEIKRIIIE